MIKNLINYYNANGTIFLAGQSAPSNDWLPSFKEAFDKVLKQPECWAYNSIQDGYLAPVSFADVSPIKI